MLKMLEKEMSESLNESEKRNKGNLNVQFFVNGKKVSPNAVPVLKKGEPVKKIERKERKVSKEKMELLAKFPKVEPESEVRRLSGRVIYNIYVPGVETVEDVFVNQLENSIEVKTLGKDKVYSKILNLKLPLKGYDLVEDNLVLELGAE
jgi:hypothetical protein